MAIFRISLIYFFIRKINVQFGRVDIRVLRHCIVINSFFFILRKDVESFFFFFLKNRIRRIKELKCSDSFPFNQQLC